jgi:hypothetical protein
VSFFLATPVFTRPASDPRYFRIFFSLDEFWTRPETFSRKHDLRISQEIYARKRALFEAGNEVSSPHSFDGLQSHLASDLLATSSMILRSDSLGLPILPPAKLSTRAPGPRSLTLGESLIAVVSFEDATCGESTPEWPFHSATPHTSNRTSRAGQLFLSSATTLARTQVLTTRLLQTFVLTSIRPQL